MICPSSGKGDEAAKEYVAVWGDGQETAGAKEDTKTFLVSHKQSLNLPNSLEEEKKSSKQITKKA